MMTTANPVVDTLYQVFTTTILFPSPATEEHCRALCQCGLAERVSHGHALGYRITPRGYAEATALWGHEQR